MLLAEIELEMVTATCNNITCESMQLKHAAELCIKRKLLHDV